MTDPPTGGDKLAELARRLDESRVDVAGAAGILVVLGLATHDGERLRPTPAARLFDALGLVRA